LKNPDPFSSAETMNTILPGELNFAKDAPAIMGVDPPIHTRLRKLVNRAFTPRLIAALESRIRAITSELVAAGTARGEFDLVSDLASPLPVTVIAEMLGVEPERRADFRQWGDAIVNAHGGVQSEAERARVRQLNLTFRSYFQEKVETRRTHPQGDLITALVQAQEDQQMLSTEEILVLIAFLLLAGSETTTNLIGNAMVVLEDHPQEMTKVRANPTLIDNVIEETLRYEGPIQSMPRHILREVQIAGTTIPAGAVVVPLFASANRDENKFPHPDRFDLTRDTEGHVGFGYGIHYCLGAPLARLEAKIALAELLRLRGLRRKNQDVEFGGGIIVRGPKTLPLVCQH